MSKYYPVLLLMIFTQFSCAVQHQGRITNIFDEKYVSVEGLSNLATGDTLTVILYAQQLQHPQSKKAVGVIVESIADIKVHEVRTSSKLEVSQIDGGIKPRTGDIVVIRENNLSKRKRWVERMPKNFQEEWLAELPFRRGLMACRDDSYQKAIDFCHQAMKYRKNDAKIPLLLSICYLKSGKSEDKNKQLELALSIDRKLFSNNQPEFRELIDLLIQSNYERHLRQGTLAYVKRDYKTAIRHWQTALLWNLGSEGNIRTQIDNAYEEWLSGKFEAPEQKQSLEKQQRAWELLKTGYAAYQNRDSDAAIYSFEGSLSLQPTLTEAHKWLGYIYALQGNKEDAKNAFRKALDLQPDFILIGDTPEEVHNLFETEVRQGKDQKREYR